MPDSPSSQLLTFYVPLRYDSTRRKRSRKEWNGFIEWLALRYGGYTIHPTVSGGWTGPNGELIKDRSTPVSIISYNLDSDIRILAPVVKKTFDQQAVFFYCGANAWIV